MRVSRRDAERDTRNRKPPVASPFVPRVFISYRRSDTTAGYASWIYDRLKEHLGADHVFMDVDSLPIGVDFFDQLERALQGCEVALVLMGPAWLAEGEDRRSRLDDPEDFVRLEVATALESSGVRVVPVLVDGATMPDVSRLPEDIRPLTRRQALVFDRHGGTALKDLVSAIDAMAVERKAGSSQANGPDAAIAKQPSAEAARGRRVGWLLAGVGMVVAAVVAVIALSGGASSSRTAVVIGTTHVGKNPSAIAVGQSSVWVANFNSNTVMQIDPSSGVVVGLPAAVGKAPDGIAVGEGTIWALSALPATVWRIDASGGVIGNPIPVRRQDAVGELVSYGAPEIALGNGTLWVANSGDNTVTRIDTSTGTIIGNPIPVGRQPSAIAVGQGGVWVANRADNTVMRINPNSGKVIGRPILVGRYPEGIAVGQGGVWVANEDDTVTRIDPSKGMIIGNPIPVGQDPVAIAVGRGSVWVANRKSFTVTRIDPSTGAVIGNPIPVGREPVAIAAGQGGVWVANNLDNTVTRISPG